MRDLHAEMAIIATHHEFFRRRDHTLWERKALLLKNRSNLLSNPAANEENEDRISMIDLSISENDVELRKTNYSIAKLECLLSKAQELCTDIGTMKSTVLGANYEMVSWIMEGYAVNLECKELSPLGDCLVDLMRQPSACKISADGGKALSEVRLALSDEMRRAIFHDGSLNQHGFSVYVEFLALSFIYGRDVSRKNEAHIYARYDTIMQIGRYFLDGHDQFNPKSVSAQSSSGGESMNKKFCSDEGTATRNEASAVPLQEENSMGVQLSPKGGTYFPYRDQSSRPNFQFGKEGKFPCFLMEGNKDRHLILAKNDLKMKLERLNERTYSGLPFYISVAITPTEAQFMLSEYDRPIKELGKVYNVSTYDGAAEFLLAFLNLLPIFNGFQKILDTRELAWNVDKTASSGVTKPICERSYINSTHYVDHFYFQKQINATHGGVSSWEDLLHIYTKLTEMPVPDSLATPMKGQNLAEIFTSDANTFTLHLLPVAFPSRAEWFLTSYRVLAQCFYDILSALMWLHQYDIVHRDVVGRNILKRICKKGFILTDFECSARSGAKFAKDERNDFELPARFNYDGYTDTTKWFPLDDISQLRMFLLAATRMVSFSHHSLDSFERLFDFAALNSPLKDLMQMVNRGKTTDGCSVILHDISVCFKKYKSPFEREQDCFGGYAP